MSDGGWVMAYGGCFSCQKPFSFNPNKVPSIRMNGVKEPVCGDCMTLVNNQRVAIGQEPHFIHPDAYEPMPASDLGE